MSIDKNKASIHRLFDELNNGNLEIMDEILTDNFVRYASDGRTMGKEEYKHIMSTLSDALPDLQSTIEQLVAEGDNVAIRFTWSGTHKGDLMGIPPTNKKIVVKEAYFARFENGKIAEYINFMDKASMFKQLGVSPPGG